jgi:uncharacterized protein (DUF305 family)
MGVSTPTAPPDAEQPAPREARWIRPVLAVVAVVGLLLLGAAGGLLVGIPGSTAPAVPATDSVDVGFSQDMTVHHQQAVTMGSWARDHTTDPIVHQLAADIEATQTAQIGRMQGWLELWNAPSLPVGGHMAWMSEPSHTHTPAAPAGGVASMPGMANEEELAALRAATGPELDVLFLQLMLRHHQGGAGMAEYTAERAGLPQVRNLATQMLRSQSTESDYMRQLLAERGGQPLPL